MKFFGFELKKIKDESTEKLPSVVSPSYMDGSAISTNAVGGYYSYVMDIEGQIKNENDLIRRYRETAAYSDCDTAIDDIVCEIIVSDVEDENQVELLLDKTKLPENIKKKILDEFDLILELLKFQEQSYDIVRTWYIDGRLYYNILLDPKAPEKGIQELRFVDPRKIKKVKNIIKEKNQNGSEVVKTVEEYFVYNENGVSETNAQGTKLSKDSVVFVPSGLIDANTGMALSYLHKAIKPVNQLKMIEDANVIYTITRAPERRIFYIDVGDLPKMKAEQYVADIMAKYRNKITYDVGTGEIKDAKQHMSMLEDFWMPKRGGNGGDGTQITTLQGSGQLNNVDQINYFQQKVYKSMNVPIGRLQNSDGFNLGRSSEISREEIKFSKFVARLRKKFSILFLDVLRVQLVAKGIVSLEDWEELRPLIRVNYMRDNYFTELKELEIMQQRFGVLQMADPYAGKYISMKTLRNKILRLDDDEMKEEDKEIADEVEAHPEYFPFLYPPEEPQQPQQQEQAPQVVPQNIDGENDK